ncbi:MAG: carboxy terminal-processing peptidase [Gammaproteobacteria bacterium]|nr:carboxy terminal-processing peptidase [Gammaproteobacteria bacterium]
MPRLIRLLVGVCVVSLTSSLVAEVETAFLPTLEPLPVHPRAARFIVDQVRSNHLIRNAPLDDDASSQILDRYLEVLDRRKQFYLASDIEEFETFRYQFDDALKRGRLELAYKMVNRLQSRRDARYDWILERLEPGIESFDLATSVQLPLDADDLAWPRDKADADLRWEHNLTDAIIHMRLNQREPEEILNLLTKRYTNRRNQNRQFTSEEAFADYINSFTHIYDPHTVYFSPRDAEDFHMSMRMSLEGIGALLGIEDEYVRVISLVKGGPAELDGELKAADRIVAVGQDPNGPMIDVVGRRIQDVVDLIRGPRGTVVRLEVLEPVSSGGASKVIAITRDKVKLEETAAKKKVFTLEDKGIERKIGVIELPKMYADLAGEQRGEEDYRSATRDVEKLIGELKEEDIDGLVLDLRNNGGGSLPEAHKLVGLFIETGPTVLVKGLGRRQQAMKDNDPYVAYDGPLAVLVNRSSASASEIFAGAIQDYGRGLVLGTRTYGKGSIQSILSLNHGQLKITQGKYYRITGETTQHSGVKPDIEFPELIDPEAVGESSYSNALALDVIEPAEYEVIADIDGLISDLTKRHEERTRNDPHFDYYRRFAERINFNRNITHVSLNEDERRARREESATWRLKTENDYLRALGEEPAESIDELDDIMRELPRKRAEQVDGMVEESGRILLDYINSNPTLAYREASAAAAIGP